MIFNDKLSVAFLLSYLPHAAMGRYVVSRSPLTVEPGQEFAPGHSERSECRRKARLVLRSEDQTTRPVRGRETQTASLPAVFTHHAYPPVVHSAEKRDPRRSPHGAFSQKMFMLPGRPGQYTPLRQIPLLLQISFTIR